MFHVKHYEDVEERDMYKLLINSGEIKTELYVDTFEQVLLEHCKSLIGKYGVYVEQLLPYERTTLKKALPKMAQYAECQNVAEAVSKMLCDYIDTPETLHFSGHWIILISTHLINNT